MKRTLLSAIYSCTLVLFAFSQNLENRFWNQVDDESVIEQNERRYIIPEKYGLYELLLSDLIAYMRNCPTGKVYEVKDSDFFISFPFPDGKLHTFRILETPIMPESLSHKFPGINTYSGIEVGNPVSSLKMDITPQGFHAMVLGSEGQIFIDPYSLGNTTYYISYFKKDLHRKLPIDDFKCEVEGHFSIEPSHGSHGLRSPGDCKLRTYKVAIAATGEYTTFHGGLSNALAAINTTINRINLVYERDLTINLNLIANNDLIIYLDPNTDPYSNSNTYAMLSQNQNNLSSVIGDANYDIGHVFGVGGGGVATLGGVCGGSKARGVSTLGAPVGDPFDIDYVSHEMGHQFGANHTQNADCNRVTGAAYEPGSGNTIMGYAGVCHPYNVQSNSDAMFHANSIDEISSFVTLGYGDVCPVKTNLNNSSPTINAGGNYTIPHSTPFMLEAQGFDPDGDPIIYSWEQWDPEFGQVMPPASTNTLGPLFRTYYPEGSIRYFPNIYNILNGINTNYEILPSVSRNMEFRVIGRGLNSGIGCTDEDNMNVVATSYSGPFKVIYPNTAVNWSAYDTVTVTWDKANTDNAPVYANFVDILLSTTGGFAFVDTIATVLNTGSADIIVPNVSTNKARIMVKGHNNIFFDVSDENFIITPGIVQNCPTPSSLWVTDVTAVSAKLNWTPVNEAHHYRIRGNSVGQNGYVSLYVPNNTINSYNVSGLEGNNSYFWQIKAYCSPNESISSEWSQNNTFTTINCTPPSSLYTNNIGLNIATLNWSTVPNAVNYTIRGGVLGQGFVNLTVSGLLSSFVVYDLIPGEDYVWQIRSNCSASIRSSYSPLTIFSTLNGLENSAKTTDEDLNIYPNPASGTVIVEIGNSVTNFENSSLIITDSKGLITNQLDLSGLESSVSLDISKYSPGFYFIHLNNSETHKVKKLIISEF